MITPTGQVDRVAGLPATLMLAPVDEEGGALELAEPATVTVTDGAGTVIVNDASATINPETHASMSYELTTMLALLDTYSVIWKATVSGALRSWRTELEFCGGYLFTVASFRALKMGLESMPAADIIAARRLAEERIETACGVAFVPRGARAAVRGDGSRTLILPHVALRQIYSVAIDDVSLTPADIAALRYGDDVVGAGIVERPAGFFWPAGSIVTMHYAHGYDRPPAPVSNAARLLAKEFAVPDRAISPRATSVSTEAGIFRITTAGTPGHPTGLPEVDAVIAEFSRQRPRMG